MPKRIDAPKVKFNLFDPKTDQETYVILNFRYSEGKHFRYATGRKVSPLRWDRKAQREIHVPVDYSDPATKRRELFKKRLEPLNDYLNRLEKICEDIYDRNDRLSVESFRIDFLKRLEDYGKKQAARKINFIEFCEQFYQERASQPTAKKGSLQVLNKVLYHLKAYAADKGRTVEFSDLGEDFYNDFKKWLFSAPRELSTNYVKKTFQNLKLFVKKAENRQYHNDRMYREFQITAAPITKIYLSFDELEQLGRLDLSAAPHLERARDLFLIGAYSGLRFGDQLRIRPENIVIQDGEKYLHIIAEKTEQAVIIPLHNNLDTILKKYDYAMPKTTNQEANRHLKEVGRLAGLTQNIVVQVSKGGILKETLKPKYMLLKTHVGRRSFATNYYKKYPHLIDEIMKITGHTTETMFRAYIVSDKAESAARFGKALKDNHKK